MNHSQLTGAGRITHDQIDKRLPTPGEKRSLTAIDNAAPRSVTGARDDPEAALANLLTALAALGLITDSTTAS